jgi:hypothetical protein
VDVSTDDAKLCQDWTSIIVEIVLRTFTDKLPLGKLADFDVKNLETGRYYFNDSKVGTRLAQIG